MASFKELIDSEIPVLVDFHATWCGPCKQLSPVIEKVAKTFNNRLKVIKVDVDKNTSAAQAYQVKGVPTMILFKEGKIVWRSSGYMDEGKLSKTLQAFI
jgi:thioredoxin 1